MASYHIVPDKQCERSAQSALMRRFKVQYKTRRKIIRNSRPVSPFRFCGHCCCWGLATTHVSYATTICRSPLCLGNPHCPSSSVSERLPCILQSAWLSYHCQPKEKPCSFSLTEWVTSELHESSVGIMMWALLCTPSTSVWQQRKRKLRTSLPCTSLSIHQGRSSLVKATATTRHYRWYSPETLIVDFGKPAHCWLLAFTKNAYDMHLLRCHTSYS